MPAAVGVEVGSALAPLSGSGSEPSPSAPCSPTPTTITRITTRMAATTHPPQRTIRRRLIIRPPGAVGAPITITITLVERRGTPPLAPELSLRSDGLMPSQVIYRTNLRRLL